MFIVVQLARTKIHRTNFSSIVRQTNSAISDLYGEEYEYPMLSENEVRKVAVSSLEDTSELVSAVSGKVGFLIRANESERFVISDNPVVVNNSFPYGDRGLASLGIEIYLPLSTEITLALYCPSVFRKMDIAVQPFSDMDDDDKMIFQGVIDGVKNGVPVSLGKHTTEFLNSLQLSQSSKFLYGMQASDFLILIHLLKNWKISRS